MLYYKTNWLSKVISFIRHSDLHYDMYVLQDKVTNIMEQSY